MQRVQLVVVDGQRVEDGEARQDFMVDGLEVVVREDERVEVVQRDEGVRGDGVKLKRRKISALCFKRIFKCSRLKERKQDQFWTGFTMAANLF